MLVFGNTKVGESKGTVTCKAGYYNNRKDIQPEDTSSALVSCSVNGTWSNLPNCTRKGDYLFIDLLVFIPKKT